MTPNQRPEIARRGSWKGRLIIGGVSLVLALSALLPVLLRDQAVELTPSALDSIPGSKMPEINFEERLLAVVPEELEYAGVLSCPDGKTVTYGTLIPGPFGSTHQTVLGARIRGENGDVDPMVSPDGKTIAFVGRPGSSGRDGKLSVDVGSTKGERFDQVDQFTFSSDSKTYAYRAQQGGTWFVVAGGKKLPAYELVENPAFSPDGSTLCYTAQRGGKRFFVVGEQTYGSEFSECHDPAVSPDGKNVAFVGVNPQVVVNFGIWEWVRKKRSEFVVVNGKKGSEFDRIEGLRFSPDGGSVVYQAYQGEGGTPSVSVVQAERGGESFRAVRDLDFSPDGRSLVYTASQGRGWFVVVNSKKGETFEGVSKPVFSPDGSTFAYVAEKNHKALVVTGERKGAEYDRVEGLRFGRDGKTPIYAAWKGKRRFVISPGHQVEDTFVGDFDIEPRILCSPDGRTFAYRASKNNSCLIVGGRRFNIAPATEPVFSPDGTKLAFGSLVRTSGKTELWWKVLSGPFEAETDPRAPPPTPEDGLVGYWKLDEADSTRAFDSSGRGNHGVYYHAPQASDDTPGSKFKNPASRLFVAGAPQRIEVPEAPSLSLHGSLTLAAWIRPANEDSTSDRGILMKCDWVHKSHSGGYSLRLLKNGRPVFSVRPDQGGTRALVATGQRLPPDTWTHVAGVYDLETRTSRLYLNGDQVASQGSVPPPFYSDEPLWIGSNDGEGQFHGMLDELRVYRRALSGPEILALASGEARAEERIEDPALLRRMDALPGGQPTKASDSRTLADLEAAAQRLLSAPLRSIDSISFLGDVYSRSRNGVLRVGIANALVQAFENGNPEQQRSAALALGYPGPFPAAMNDILGEVIKRTPDKGVRSALLNALTGRGWAAAPAALAVLTGEHTAPGDYVADCPDLAAISGWICQDTLAAAIDGKSGPSILPQLQVASTSPDRAVRATVAQILATYAGRSGEVYALVSAAFLPMLGDPDPLIRRRALRTFSLALLGAPHERKLYRSAIAPLVAAIKDGRADVRFSAGSALVGLSSVAPSEVSQAMRLLQADPDKDVRELSSEYLKDLAPTSPSIEASLKRVTRVGGPGGGPFIDRAPRGGHLVGLRVTTWSTGGREFIKSLVPLYRVKEASERGQVHGQPSGPVQETLSKPGYAIGGLIVQGSDRLGGFRGVFMKITPGGLDPKEKYIGDWIGGRSAEPEFYMGGDGVSIIGVSGRQGADVDALSVVFDPAAMVDGAPAATDGEGFLQKWLVLGAIPLGDLAPDSPEALIKAWVPNLPGLRPKQHDKAIVGGVEYDWKVGESLGFSLPLGEEDNSVSIVVSYVMSDVDLPEATLLTGSDDASIWYLNGREVQRFVGRRAVHKDQDRTTSPIVLKKGANVLVAVVANAGLESGACARFVDSTGRPIRLLAGAEPSR